MRRLPSLLRLLPLLLLSCGAVRFDLAQDLPEQTVQGSLLGGVLPSFIDNPIRLTIDIRSEVARRGTGPARKALLKELTLSITPHDMPANNFDFLTEVHLFVEGPGLQRAEVARSAPVPRSATTLRFEVLPDVDLLPYVNAGASLTATATGNQPRQNVTFDGHVVVEVFI
jgi:hypothetical protein